MVIMATSALWGAQPGFCWSYFSDETVGEPTQSPSGDPTNSVNSRKRDEFYPIKKVPEDYRQLNSSKVTNNKIYALKNSFG